MNNIIGAGCVLALLLGAQMRSAGDSPTNAVLDPCVNLSAPVLSNGQVTLVLGGEPGVSYVVQSSPDLQNWTPAATNSDNTITRTVSFAAGDGAGFYRVSRDPLPRFTCAIATRSNIVSGSGLVTDSYNSGDTNLSTNGQYDPTKASTNGNVASRFGPISLGSLQVNGSLYLGPTATNLSGTNNVTGSIRHDFNTCYSDATLPAGPVPAPSFLVNGVISYLFVVSGYYCVSNSLPIIVFPGVNVRVRVDATSFTPASIHVMATNGISGVLSLYQVSGSGTLNGNVAVDSEVAGDFFYYGLPGVTSIKWGGTSTFFGVIYAPEANLTLYGAGSTNNYIGALTVGTLTMNGHWEFHFDENLLSAGPMR